MQRQMRKQVLSAEAAGLQLAGSFKIRLKSERFYTGYSYIMAELLDYAAPLY